MNSYHANHPDPEVRQKYNEWCNAYDSYLARKHGFKTPEAMQKHNNSKETASFKEKLLGLAGNVMRTIGRASIKNNIRKQRRSSGNRGS